MGTTVAPPYATLFLGKLEEEHILNKFGDLFMIFLRFLDDILFVWLGTEKELHKFFAYINTIFQSIKSTLEFSFDKVDFLDNTVYIDQNRMLLTKLYTKPTDKKSRLHLKSNHQEHIKRSVRKLKDTELL